MVTKVDVANKDLTEGIKEALKPFGGIAAFVKKDERVFLKPNFNTADPFPASSNLAFLQAICQLVSSQEPKEIILGDSPTFFGNAKKYFEQINPWKLENEFKNLKVILLNDHHWVKKQVQDGKYLKEIFVTAFLDQVDKLILLPCLKTHAWAGYTGALKLAVGLLKPTERIKLHSGHLQEKIAELNTLISPDLVIMDARACFINKGPAEGKLGKPNLILASKTRVELDIEGIKIIQSFPGNSLAGIDPLELPQIKHAKELGIS